MSCGSIFKSGRQAFRFSLSVQQVVKWRTRGLCLQDAPANEGPRCWNYARFGTLENTLRVPRRFVSTCEEIDEQMELDDVAGQIQIHKVSRSSLRGNRQKTQHLNGRLRWSPKGQDEANQEASQTMHTHNSYKRVDDRDDSSESTSDATEDNEEDEASMEDSDMDSDDDGFTVVTPKEILRGVEKESFNKLSEKEQNKARKQVMDKLISAALDEPEENEDDLIQEDEQQSLRVGIIGAVNSGKSSLTNFMVKS